MRGLKCQCLADAVNRSLSEIIVACFLGEEQPRYFFDIAVIGYKTAPADAPCIGPILQGALAGHDLVSVVDLFANAIDVETRKQDDGAGGTLELMSPIWYRPLVSDMTGAAPLSAALQYCHRIAADWCDKHPQNFPPAVFLLTGGDSLNGAAEQSAERLRTLATDDGNVLLFGCLFSSSEHESVLLPSEERQLPDGPMRRFFRMCSPLPESLREGARGVAVNVDPCALLTLWLSWALAETE